MDDDVDDARARVVLGEVWTAFGGDAAALGRVAFVNAGRLRSAFAVTSLAAGAVAAAGLAAAAYAQAGPADVIVDRRLASLWFDRSFQPVGWTLPPSRDAVAGDYAAADGWIRLHTNAAHHRSAACSVLGVAPERGAVAAAVRRWTADALESAVVAAGGAAAAMRSIPDWAAHPQGLAVVAEPLVWCERRRAAKPAAVPDPARPLAGIRVLDLTRVLAGPVCTRALAGLGAEVLRIDPPGWEEPGLVPETTLGKRCARLDARDQGGRARLHALLAGADVLVHGYRPGALQGLGLGAADRARLCPDLIDVSLDAYGWTGPWAGRRGFDSLIQMSAGIADAGMRRFGAPCPTPLPVQALDHATGWILAAAVLRGLAERRDGTTWTARISLARVAALLSPEDSEPNSFEGVRSADFSDRPEQTIWGAGQRLRPPFTISGTPLRWDSPASPLGSAEAEWQA